MINLLIIHLMLLIYKLLISLIFENLFININNPQTKTYLLSPPFPTLRSKYHKKFFRKLSTYHNPLINSYNHRIHDEHNENLKNHKKRIHWTIVITSTASLSKNSFQTTMWTTMSQS